MSSNGCAAGLSVTESVQALPGFKKVASKKCFCICQSAIPGLHVRQAACIPRSLYLPRGRTIRPLPAGSQEQAEGEDPRIRVQGWARRTEVSKPALSISAPHTLNQYQVIGTQLRAVMAPLTRLRIANILVGNPMHLDDLSEGVQALMHAPHIAGIMILWRARGPWQERVSEWLCTMRPGGGASPS